MTALGRVLDRLAPGLTRALEDGVLSPSGHVTPAAIAALARTRDLTVVVTATTAEAEALALSVGSFGVGETMVWPGWDTHPLERVSPDADAMAARVSLRARLHHDDFRGVVVAPVRAIAQILPPTIAEPLIVHRGDVLDRDHVLNQLVAWGYRREEMVEHRGEFAVRGGIVDVWSPQDVEPSRLDFFGDDIERVTAIDVGTQRSLHDREVLRLVPAREWVPTEDDRALARTWVAANHWGASVLDKIAHGEMPDGVEGFMTLFVTSPHTLLDEVAADAVVVVDPTAVTRRLHDVLEEERELTETVARTWGATQDVPLLHRTYDDAVLPFVTHTLTPVMSEPYFEGPPVIQGDPARLAQHVRDWVPDRRGVVLTSSEAAATRLAETLRGEGLEVTTDPERVLDVRLSVVVGGLLQGFSSLEPPITVWSETDLTGRRYVHRAARTRTRKVEGFFDDLEIGSYVVHVHHGVARFAGTTTRAIDGVVRDYLILEFKDGKSYWPTDQIDVLTPYTGGDAPALSRMGGAEWQKQRGRAKAAAMLVAQELVALYQARLHAPGFAFSPDTTWQHEMESLFPFPLTSDQAEAVAAVKADMELPRPMDRLVCADVGFGKTEIAVRAIFKAVQDNKQAALLVPTTLLASQHHATLRERFAGFPVNVALLSRFVDDAEAARVVDGLRDGSIDVVVGTHRLLGKQVVFKDLGLLVVDEEQRFGVDHKEAIKQATVGVDVLTLSASPIPRTLEMSLAGIREMSMVTTPPADRRPILTHVGEMNDAAIIEAVRRELLREGQVFYVHNRISDIHDVARRLGQLVPDARIVVAHGQMDEGTLERTMIDFWERRFDVLVCTTIVESGIDLPNVNTLIVDRAERLGLGQMHQLRGRVGRGGQRAYAYLFYPAGMQLSEKSHERLRTIGDNTALGSGFKIAMRDLEIRGAGTLLGQHQSGPMAAVGYDLYIQLVAEAVNDAKGIVPVTAPTMQLDVPGDAHLPRDYVSADDARLEAYRKLAGVTTREDLDDVAAEWIDRYGALPPSAQGLVALTSLKVACLERGITTISVLPAKPGGRSQALVRISPVVLPLSRQMALRRQFGAKCYDDLTHEIRLDVPNAQATPQALEAFLHDIFATS